MKTRFVTGCFAVAWLMGAAPFGLAGEPSDLLTIDVKEKPNGKTQASVRIDPGDGPSIQETLEGSGEMVDLLGSAVLEEFTIEPIFDEAAYPEAPGRVVLVYAPVSLAPGQKFFGWVGYAPPDAPGITTDELRNVYAVDYEIEIDGVKVDSDILEALGPIESSYRGGTFLTFFNVTQQFKKPGTHHLIYRGIPTVDLNEEEPAGIWEFHFTIVVEDEDESANGGDDTEDASDRASDTESAVGRFAALANAFSTTCP